MPDDDPGLRLQALLLADHATVREGMLSVLSAGITRVTLPAYPGQLAAYLVVVVYIPPDRMEATHQCDVKFKYPELVEQIASLNLTFQVQAERFAGEGLYTPFALPIHGIPWPHPGQVDVQVSLDKQHRGDLSFWLLPV